MSSESHVLFSPFYIGKEKIKNRFVMGPMGFSQFFDSFGAINNDGVEYYAERAKGGFGMLVVGGMPVDLDVEGYDPRWCENPLYAPHGLSAEQVSSTSDALLMEQNALRN